MFFFLTACDLLKEGSTVKLYMCVKTVMLFFKSLFHLDV